MTDKLKEANGKWSMRIAVGIILALVGWWGSYITDKVVATESTVTEILSEVKAISERSQTNKERVVDLEKRFNDHTNRHP